jgi:large subunit ribosomal protein L18
MLNKKVTRLRRAKATRARIARMGVARLSIHRSNLHIYANIISADGGKVLAAASTLDAELRKQISGNGGNKAAAKLVGTAIAQKAKAAGVDAVAFDRAGFQYHGRVQALADAAREAGLKF